MEYRVAKDRGVLTPGGEHLKPGEKVDFLLFGQRIKSLVAKGFVEEFDPDAVVEVVPEFEPRTGLVTPSIWTMDPAPLAYLDLDILNILIMEKDDRVEAFDTKEEAIAWLSQDYVAPTVGA
jgi:hypothetical protein